MFISLLRKEVRFDHSTQKSRNGWDKMTDFLNLTLGTTLKTINGFLHLSTAALGLSDFKGVFSYMLFRNLLTGVLGNLDLEFSHCPAGRPMTFD